MLKSGLARLRLNWGSAPDEGSARLERVVAQHRGEATASVLARLSVQTSDPAPEEVVEPLYGEEAYGSSTREQPN